MIKVALAILVLQALLCSRAQEDSCASSIDLSQHTSPFSGSTASLPNTYSTSCGGSGNEQILFIDVPDGMELDIGISSVAYDSRHETRWGGVCPGQNLVECTDDPDNHRHVWRNRQGSTQRAYFIIDAWNIGSGNFTLSWAVAGSSSTTTPTSTLTKTTRSGTTSPTSTLTSSTATSSTSSTSLGILTSTSIIQESRTRSTLTSSTATSSTSSTSLGMLIPTSIIQESGAGHSAMSVEIGIFVACSLVLICCSSAICASRLTRYNSRPKAGSLELSDKEGGKHKFNFRVRRAIAQSRSRSISIGSDTSQAHAASSDGMSCVLPEAQEPKDEDNVKILVKWDVDIEKYRASSLDFSGRRSLTLQSGMSGSSSSNDLETYQETAESPHHFSPKGVAMPSEHIEVASTSKCSPCSPKEQEHQACEAYLFGDIVEYYSTTHGLWVQGQIGSHGSVPSGTCTMPSYTVMLRSNSQQRGYVQLSHLRLPFEIGSKVSVLDETVGVWHPAFVECYKKYPFPLAYVVKIEHSADFDDQSRGDQDRQTRLVPAHNVRPAFEDGSEVDVYLGVALGWVAAVVCSNCIRTWPEVAVKLHSSEEDVVGMMSDAGGQFLNVQYYQVRLARFCL